MVGNTRKQSYMSELLLELYSEEIPAFMQKKAEQSYHEIFAKIFFNNQIEFGDIKIYVGPRRVAVHISNISNFVSAKEIEIKGPRIDAPTAAIDGFCRSNNITKDHLLQKSIKDQLCYVYIHKIPDTLVGEVLHKLIPEAINSYVWPKSMRWGAYELRWIRPLKNILCLLDDKVLPIEFGHLKANNLTYGHHFIANQAIEISNFTEYREKLAKAYVIIDRQVRENLIQHQLNIIAEKHNLVLKDDAVLLEEVTGLVEYPNVMMGKIKEKFLHVPPEILVTSMRTHQRYFSVYDKKGNFAPYFLFVSNTNTANSELIINGNEKVLSARLSDALYFYSQDLQVGLESRLPKLKQLIFHAKLGSIYDKTERVAKICEHLMPDDESLQIAAKLYKGDLACEVVGEFPELQGIMGYYYALHAKLSEEAAICIRDHYKPQGPTDSVPVGSSAVFAIADKIDSLVGLIIAGEYPTGSKDPYALRRQALGIIRIILENKLTIDLKELVIISASIYRKRDIVDQVMVFLEDRARFYFKNQYDISLINAVLSFDLESNLVDLQSKMTTLRVLLESEKGQNLLTSFKRAKNIIKDVNSWGHINSNYFSSEYEIKLNQALLNIQLKLTEQLASKNFIGALENLSEITEPLNSFFDNILIKDPDQNIANNRILLLTGIVALFDKIAKFNQL